MRPAHGEPVEPSAGARPSTGSGRAGEPPPGGSLTFTTIVEIKARRAGERVSFRARVLRGWEVGGRRMCLAGDATALTRVEMGDHVAEEGRSYEFRDALVHEYPGGWHSVSLGEGSALVPLAAEDVPVSQDESYIEYTYKILSGVQRKKARKEGRIGPWRHPAASRRGKREVREGKGSP